MSGLLILLSALLASPAAAGSKPVATADHKSAKISAHSEALEQEYEKLLEEDDAAQSEADKWIRDAEAFKAKGVPFSNESLTARIEQRFAPVRKAYEDFLQLHPDHVRARLAYGSFLYETGDEEKGVAQWDKARQLDPKNPAAWNNLANHYGHRGPVKQAFSYYEKALELDPNEPVYLQNFATTLYLFRKDAMEQYNIAEPEVFNRSLELYRKAIKLDPENFPLATDYAQSFYGIKPLRVEEALTAWTNALKIAHDQFEREGVYLHLARVELNSGRFQEAHQHLNKVADKFYAELKTRLERNLAAKEGKGAPVSDATLSDEPVKAAVSKPKYSPPRKGELPLDLAPGPATR